MLNEIKKKTVQLNLTGCNGDNRWPTVCTVNKWSNSISHFLSVCLSHLVANVKYNCAKTVFFLTYSFYFVGVVRSNRRQSKNMCESIDDFFLFCICITSVPMGLWLWYDLQLRWNVNINDLNHAHSHANSVHRKWKWER